MFQLAPHQAKSVGELKNGSVLVGGVGSGKSVTGLEYFTRLDPTRPIQVITTAKKRDSGEWFADAMMMSLRNELNVDSWNNIKNYVDTDAFFIFDEQRVVGKGAWSDAYIKIAKKQHSILLSATPADTWMDLVPVFIANGFYRNRTDFNEQHVKFSRFTKYPKVDGYYDEWKLEHHRKSIFVEMPFLKTAVREDHIVQVDFDLDEQRQLYVERFNYIEDRPLKDAGEMMRLMRYSANMHPSRMDELKEIINERQRVIVYYNHNHELELLRTLHSEMDIPVAEWNGHLHQDIPLGNRWVYFVQYLAGAEGWNCVTTDTVVFYSLPYSYRQLEQAKGRIDRLNTTYAVLHYYIFKSRAIIDQSIWKALYRKKNFQASAFAKKAWPKPDAKTRLN